MRHGWPCSSRQHVRPVQTLQHQAGAPVALHDVDQLWGDAVPVQRAKGIRLGPVAAESGTVQFDDRVGPPRVHLGLAARAQLGS
jgi:hypothetical protein